MPTSLPVPLLDQLAPDGFDVNGQYMVEFDADSLWYETSLTIAATALKRGMKTEYHVFQHFPTEAIDALSALGVDARKLEQDGLLSIWDSYTETTEFEAYRAAGKGWPSDRQKPLDIVSGSARWIERTKAGFPEEEKHWLHLDDNTGIFLQYNDEKTFVDRWRTGILPAVRARECPHFLSFPKGIAPDAFYTKFEALCDGIIDLKSEESAGGLERFLRIRKLRGKTFDSRWQRLTLERNGKVVISPTPPAPESRRLAAIMFTDVVDFTASTQLDEAAALELLRDQQDMVRPLLLAHHGREIKSTGDGFLVEFESALEATRCAIEIQQSLHEHNLAASPASEIRIRIGIHLGDVVHSAGDVLGDSVNIAARIEPLSEPGGICITEPVFGQVRNKIASSFEKLEPQRLKNVRFPLDVYKVVLPWMTPSAPVTIVGPTGIAVLPFSNISPDPRDEYIADGLTEEMITVLSQVRDLRVIARTSTMMYKSSPKAVSQIAAELGVSSILEGSVRKAGNRLRITTQLIDARTQGHVWARSFDRDLDDVFAVQTEIATQVAEALKIELRGSEARRLGSRTPLRADSYLAYLKGRALMHEMPEVATKLSTTQAARAQFEQAISLDPKNAAAHSGLADVTFGSWWVFPEVSRSEIEALSRRSAARAVELDPNLAEAHVSLAQILRSDYEYSSAEAEFKVALSLNPSYSRAHYGYAWLLADEGRSEDALVELTLAEAADPLWIDNLVGLARLLGYLGRSEEALAKIEKIRELRPNSSEYHAALLFYHSTRSEPRAAAEDLDQYLQLADQSSPGEASSWRPVQRAMYYAWSGEPEKAKALLRQEERSPTFPEAATWIMIWAFAELHDLDGCFRTMEKAWREHVGFDVWHFRLSPTLAHVRSDARFPALLKKMNLS
jgi:adenylate cyclase